MSLPQLFINRIKFLEADANIKLMNGDLNAALEGFEEMEVFCSKLGEAGKAQEARLAKESILKRLGRG
jgi:hypothetical protein